MSLTLRLLGLLLLTPAMVLAQHGDPIDVTFDVGDEQANIGESPDYVSVEFPVEEVLAIDLSQSEVSFPNPTSQDYLDGYSESPDTVWVTHHANISHVVAVEGAVATMSGPEPKPITDIEWLSSADPEGPTWQPLSTALEPLTGDYGPGEYHSSFSTVYRIAVDETEASGTYSAPWTITVIPAN